MERKRPNQASEDGGRYTGFSGHFENKRFIFDSKEERDRWQIQQYGAVRNAWREEDEATDDRPRILHGACRCRGCREYAGDFWRDATERMTYEAAVEANPKRPDEGAMTYIARIAGIVEGKYQSATKAMPRPRMSKRETDARLEKLRTQIGERDDR